MATIYLSGNVGAAQALNYTVNVPVSSAGLSDYRLDGLRVLAWMSTNAYGTTYGVRVRLLNSGGEILGETIRYDIKFNSSNYTGATWDFVFSTGIDVNAIASVEFFGLNDASKIFVKSTQNVEIVYTPITSATTPTSATVAPALCETDPTLTSSGASGGSANAITAYEIQYAQSTDGTTWGGWAALKTVSSTSGSLSTTVTLPTQRGYHRKYRLRTRGAAGASYYSPWKETNSIKRNSLPTAPTAFTASPGIYVSGPIALDYSGASDPDGNLSTHNVQYAIKTGVGEYGAWADLSNGVTSNTPTLAPGQSIKYRVRAVDALGAVSDWLESNSCVKNTAPATPTINYPQAGKTTHNSRPRALVTIGADPEGHLQQIVADGYTPSRSSGLTAGSKVVLRRTANAGEGTVAISVKSADEYGEQSSATTRNTTYQAPAYTDAILEAGVTKIKAAHINELRTNINNVRQYYGLSNYAWAETITAGVTKSRGWMDHVTEMHAAVNEVISIVNGWDTQSITNRIPVPMWLTLGSKPSADVVTQLRSVVEAL